MARTYSSIDEINRHRKKRKKLYKQAKNMYKNSELSEAEFAVIKKKHKKSLARLKKAEAAFGLESVPSVLSSDGKPAPHKRTEPSDKDLAMLGTKRVVPESVTVPRNNELAALVHPGKSSVHDSVADDLQTELDEIKELYQREQFVKDKLRQRLDEETQTRTALTDQILVITNAKDSASISAKASRHTAGKMKKIAMLLFAASACLLVMFIIVFAKDIQGEQQRIVDAKGAGLQLQEKLDEITTLEKALEEIRKAELQLKKDLTTSKSNTDVAIREQDRLKQKISEVRSSQGGDIRTYDLIGLDYALLQREQPTESDENLLRQVATLHSVSVSAVRQALSDYTAQPAGNIAAGVAKILNGSSSASAFAKLKEAVLREEAIFKKLLRLAAILAGEEKMKEEKVKFLQIASSLDPSDVYLRLELSEAFVSVGNIEYAIANFKICIEQLPERADVALRLGHLLERKGKVVEALAAYEHGLLKSSDDRNLLTAVAGLKVQQGEYLPAIKLLEHCISISSNNTPGIGNIHFNLAFAYVGLGQLEKAKEHCFTAKTLGTDVSSLEAFLTSAVPPEQ